MIVQRWTRCWPTPARAWPRGTMKQTRPDQRTERSHRCSDEGNGGVATRCCGHSRPFLRSFCAAQNEPEASIGIAFFPPENGCSSVMTCQLRHRAFNDLRDEGRMHAICMERSLRRGVYPPAADGEQWPTSDGPDRVAERASAIPDKRIVVHASASRAHAVALHRTTTGRVASLHPVA